MRSKIVRRLELLYREKDIISDQLDRSYLKNDMTTCMRLEQKYEQVVNKINKLHFSHKSKPIFT
jgi:hypothetical protein